MCDANAAGGKRRFRFGLRTLLVAMTGVCAILAMVAQPLFEQRRQQRLLDEIAEKGARISVLGSMSRDVSFGRRLLALFDSSFDRNWLYGIVYLGTAATDGELARLDQLKHVKTLNLSGTRITDVGLAHLKGLTYLERLDVSGTTVGDDGISHLRKVQNLASLRVMNTHVSYKLLEELDRELPYAHFCEEKAVGELKAVGVQVVDLPRHIEWEAPSGLWSMVRSGNQAVDVVVGMNRPLSLTAQQMSHLSYLESVRDVTFHTVRLGPDSLAGLRKLPNFKSLGIWNCNVTDNDLAGIGRQERLEELVLYNCPDITSEGLKHLASLKRLKKFRVETCPGVSREAVVELGRALPECVCTYSPH